MTSLDPVSLCAETTAAWHAAWLSCSAFDPRSRAGCGGPSTRRRSSTGRPSPCRRTCPPPTSPALSPAAPGPCATHGPCSIWLRSASSPETATATRSDRPSPGTFACPPRWPPRTLPRSSRSSTSARRPRSPQFEVVSVQGFGGDDASVDPGSLHPPTVLADPRMAMLIGRVAGAPASAAMSYTTDRAVGIYGVTTIASARGHGYASAPPSPRRSHLPALLSPSPEAEQLYRRLGFGEVGTLRQWHRPEAEHSEAEKPPQPSPGTAAPPARRWPAAPARRDPALIRRRAGTTGRRLPLRRAGPGRPGDSERPRPLAGCRPGPQHETKNGRWWTGCSRSRCGPGRSR